ncbi:uncharacterized protein LOC136086931 [Hydra vulgaris]|uniref:Uncharacterized protein LOC136086931 n=1 Tax=Hydra vulgaris TaxID=6087 RepID=A0ABM4CU99_HYDVU
MLRDSKIKIQRAEWCFENLKKAVDDVLRHGRSQKNASKLFGIPRQTLRRYINKVKNATDLNKVLGRPRTLSKVQETELVSIIIEIEKRLFGLTKIDIKRLAYQKPEPTFMARASGFTKEKVDRFFDVLESIIFNQYGKIVIPPSRIFNTDESGFSVCHTPGKIVALKGKRSVGAITSLEKDKTIKVLCCVSAVGAYVPLMIIFPRVRMKPSFMDQAPQGALGVATKNGWINEELFDIWFDNFLQFTQPSNCNTPTLLILDGHSCHVKNIKVILKARRSNVIILSLPSHCTHKMQPLNIYFFKSLSSRYNSVVQSWHRQHPGTPVKEAEFRSLFSTAYGDAASVSNAKSGFRKSRIHPFNRLIFTDEVFHSSRSDKSRTEHL